MSLVPCQARFFKGVLLKVVGTKERRTPIRRGQRGVDDVERKRFSIGYPLAWAIRRSPFLAGAHHNLFRAFHS